MPGVHIVDQSLPMSHELERSRLKSHKTLPRRREMVDVVEVSSPLLGSDGTNRSQHTPSLPLTPPGQIRGGYESDTPTWSSPPSISLDQDKTLTTVISRQRSPPTPETTPPRDNLTTPKARPPFNIHPSISSQAESFQTALETLSSDDDHEVRPATLAQPEQHPPAKRLPLAPRFPLLPNGHADDEAVSSPSTDSHDSLTVRDFDSFDGNWSNGRDVESSTSLSIQQPPRSKPETVDERTTKVSTTANDTPLKPAGTSLTREKSVRDRVQEARNIQSSKSTEKFGEEIGWLPSPRQERREQRLLNGVDTWRLSTGSTTSTVEAVVIDSPPSAPRTLRHSEKRASLRSVSSPSTQSPRVSIDSGHDSLRRLVHKTARVTEQNRRSFSSDMSLPTSNRSSLLPSRVEKIPVVVIPQRASSLRASAPENQVPPRPRPLSTRRRPTTAPEISKDPVDVPFRPRKRTLSDSISRTSGMSNRGRDFAPPVIPARSSSLSAPTSRNNSRTASLTSEGLRRHAESMVQASQRLQQEVEHASPSPQLVAKSTPKIVSPELTHEDRRPESVRASIHRTPEDLDQLAPPSTIFSGQSVSSSPGPVEIMEATLISMFPHNNRSLLLVDRPQPESEAVAALHGRTFDTPQLRPPVVDPAVASPLRNESMASEMPAFKVIPPTPGDETTRPTGLSRSLSDRSRGLTRRLGSMRRAMSGRRRADTPGPHGRGFPAGREVKNKKSGKELDSKLHPFWRPRAFWDDADDDDDAGANSSGSEDLYVGNTLGMPQHRVIISGAESTMGVPNEVLIKGGRRLRKRPSHVMLRDAMVSSRLSITRPRSPYERHVRFASRFGTAMRQLSVKNIQGRLRRARQRRTLRQWEKRREKLKTRIGGKTALDPYGVDIQPPRRIH